VPRRVHKAGATSRSVSLSPRVEPPVGSQRVCCHAPVMSYLLVTGLLTFVGIVVLAAVVLVILSRRRRSAG